MRTSPSRWSFVVGIGILSALPLTASSQAPTLEQSSVARAGLSSPPVVPLPGEEGVSRTRIAVPATQWVKGGIIGAVILGGVAYALGNAINSSSENPQSQER